MNSKERVLMAVNHREPDRVPIFASFVPEEVKKINSYLKNNDTTECLIELGNDMIMVGHGFATSYYLKDDDEYYDEWGCKWKYFNNKSGRYPEVVERPLANKSKLDSYKIPDPHKPGRYDDSKAVIDKYGRDYWVFACIACTIFECAWGLRGLDELMADMIEDKDFVHALMDKVMEFPLAAGKKLIELGVDMLWTGDDVGMQTGMMISPAMWREFLKPRFAKLFQEFKRINPDIKIAYHSDGNCEVILDEMYEIGLDIINPIQPACMNPAYIKKRYGNKLAMWGAVDIQHLLPFGTSAEIDASIRQLMKDCASGGGFIVSPAHNVQSETSIENILAFYEAAKKYGRYPIAF